MLWMSLCLYSFIYFILLSFSILPSFPSFPQLYFPSIIWILSSHTKNTFTIPSSTLWSEWDKFIHKTLSNFKPTYLSTHLPFSCMPSSHLGCLWHFSSRLQDFSVWKGCFWLENLSLFFGIYLNIHSLYNHCWWGQQWFSVWKQVGGLRMTFFACFSLLAVSLYCDYWCNVISGDKKGLFQMEMWVRGRTEWIWKLILECILMFRQARFKKIKDLKIVRDYLFNSSCRSWRKLDPNHLQNTIHFQQPQFSVHHF